MLGEKLDEVRRRKLIDRLNIQGTLFLDLALLQRDYWGGSLLQDHGHHSGWIFGTAALNLLHYIPDARKWLSWVIPRILRTVEAMPRDGVIPPTSYSAPW